MRVTWVDLFASENTRTLRVAAKMAVIPLLRGNLTSDTARQVEDRDIVPGVGVPGDHAPAAGFRIIRLSAGDEYLQARRCGSRRRRGGDTRNRGKKDR